MNERVCEGEREKRECVCVYKREKREVCVCKREKREERESVHEREKERRERSRPSGGGEDRRFPKSFSSSLLGERGDMCGGELPMELEEEGTKDERG